EGLAPINVGQERIPMIGLIKNPGRWGYINTAGTLVIPMKFQLADEFYEGLAAAHLGQLSGFINHKGRFVFNAPFDVSWDFSEGLAAAEVPIDQDRETPCKLDETSSYTVAKKFGYIDRTGRLVIPPQWEYAGPFVDGLAAVSACDRASFIDKTGHVVIKTD